MNKIIPFKKNIILNNNLSEITSISLENTLSFASDNMIEGNFIISGEYKTDSNELESFDYELPFKAYIDDRFIIDSATIDIDDFYYEIVNNNVLSVNIDVKLDNVEEKEIVLEEKKWEEETLPIEEKRCIEDEEMPDKVENLFSVDNTSEYKSYIVYIVREQDTVDSIITKYNVTKELLEMYNNLDNIKIGDKIIIPAS